MRFPTAHTWRRLSRELALLDDQRVELGTFRGQMRGVGERELSGGAALGDRLLVVPKWELSQRGLPALRRLQYVRDPEDGLLYCIEHVRAVSLQSSTLYKADLSGPA